MPHKGTEIAFRQMVAIALRQARRAADAGEVTRAARLIKAARIGRNALDRIAQRTAVK